MSATPSSPSAPFSQIRDAGGFPRRAGVEPAHARRGPGPAEYAGAWMVGKRAIDLAGAGLGLIVLAPLLLAIAALIRLESRGPILFRQQRLGRGGRFFTVNKFRTMVADAEARLADLESSNEAEGGVLFKIRHDPRVTPLGRFLRRTSLDELPQLINVIRGEMSLVGPRPLQERDCLLLEQADPEGYAMRQLVKPGITGLWQIGGRSEVGHDRMVELDIAYVERWSVGLDLKILARTVGVVLSCRGAC